MPRKRFSKTEKQALAEVGIGGPVEWQNVTVWHPAILDSPILRDEFGWESVQVVNLATTKTVDSGRRVGVGPGHIRAPKG